MRKGKVVYYQCPWIPCGLKLPESDERVQRQIERCRRRGHSRVVYCPECGTPMVRRVEKR